MIDPPPDRPPETRGERWTYAIFVLLVFGLFAAEMIRDYRPVKMSMLFITLAWVPLLAIHEGGHALMARLLGWRVLAVVIGFGRTLASFRVGETRVELRALPLEGFTRPVPRGDSWPRLKSFLIYAAGALAELVVLGLLTLILGFERMTTRTDDLYIIAAQSFGAAALLGVTINVIPHTAETSHGRTANDGMGMILSLRAPREHFADLAEDDDGSDDEDR
jgi:hypothetical protein